MKLSPLLFAVVLCLSVPAIAAHPNDGSPLGMNVSVPNDFATVMPWVDMFMWIRGFERPNGTGFPPAQLDSCGWVKSLNAGEVANVGHGSGSEGHYPGGDYTLLWEGDGVIAVRGSSGASAHFVSYDSAGHRAVVHVDSTQAWWGVSITKTNPADYVRNMHLIMPGFENTWRTDIWHPSFIKALERFKTLRFMDWGATNGSTVSKWSDLKPVTWWNQGSSDYFNGFGRGGIAPLWMIRLCNRLHADGWFCIPNAADDTLVRQYATLLRDSLAPDLKIYIEYSNECWNYSFAQTGYCTSKSTQLGLSTGPAEFYALRSSQIWRIFDQVFGAQKTRLEKVLAWQQNNNGQPFTDWIFPILANQTLNPDNEQPTGIAIAPYFVNDGGDGAVRTDNVANMMNDVIANVLPAKRAQAQGLAAYARGKNLKLFAYEGGQSFWGNSSFAAVSAAAQNDPLMKTATLKYLRDWFAVGGGMFNYYAQCGLGGTYGWWGSMEYYNQPRSQAPKYDALMTFIEDSIGTVRAGAPVSYAPSRTAAGTKTAGLFSLNGGRLPAGSLRRSGVPAMAETAGTARGVYIVKDGARVGHLLVR